MPRSYIPSDFYHLQFEGEDGTIAVQSFTVFLIHFRTVYEAVESRGEQKEQTIPTPDALLALWESISPREIFNATRPHRHWDYPEFWFDDSWNEKIDAEDRLRITAIQKQSPLEITLCGMGIALAAAVIVSGGSIDFSPKGVKCRLPPLGKGIETLRRALRKKL